MNTISLPRLFGRGSLAAIMRSTHFTRSPPLSGSPTMSVRTTGEISLDHYGMAEAFSLGAISPKPGSIRILRIYFWNSATVVIGAVAGRDADRRRGRPLSGSLPIPRQPINLRGLVLVDYFSAADHLDLIVSDPRRLQSL